MVVCLGWGSLVWDPRELPLASVWRHDGPKLGVEFARQSQNGRITLVITPDAPGLQVFSAKLSVTTLEAARLALAKREGISEKNMPYSIGAWTGDHQSDHPEAATIGQWAKEARCDAVVWTALKPRFAGKHITPSAEQVVAYLSELSGARKEAAETYVRQTPKEVQTPYRSVIEQHLGWRSHTETKK